MLSDTKLRSLKPKDRPYKLSDFDGLYMYVTPSGARSWRFDYRHGGKRYTQTLGKYPDISLSDARDRLREARACLASGKNPHHERKKEKILLRESVTNTFSAIADEWYKSKENLRSRAWREANDLYLRRDLNPKIGQMPINDVTGQLILAIIKNIGEKSGVKTAERVRQTAGQIFEYAIRQLKTANNPARALTQWTDVPPAEHRRPLTPKEIPDFLCAVDRYPGLPATKIAVHLLVLTFVRKTEMVQALWDEFDLPKGMWIIPKERMKMQKPHMVPLSQQAIDLLERLKPVSFGSRYLFPSISSIEKPMSGSTINVMFQKMGYGGSFTPHGVRATASTILNELGFSRDAIERQLAHTERDEIRAAYNHADYLPERKRMMQAWADYLDGLIKERSANEHGQVDEQSAYCGTEEVKSPQTHRP
jgi:integrase